MSARTPPARGSTVTLDVSLLGRDYKVACGEGEEAELRDAVAFLDRRMRDVRESGRTTSAERVAVMAALNLAHDFQRQRASAPSAAAAAATPMLVDAAAARRRISAMRAAIDAVLSPPGKLP